MNFLQRSLKSHQISEIWGFIRMKIRFVNSFRRSIDILLGHRVYIHLTSGSQMLKHRIPCSGIRPFRETRQNIRERLETGNCSAFISPKAEFSSFFRFLSFPLLTFFISNGLDGILVWWYYAVLLCIHCLVHSISVLHIINADECKHLVSIFSTHYQNHASRVEFSFMTVKIKLAMARPH